MNGRHFMGFRQLVQKLERTTPIISILQDDSNGCHSMVFRHKFKDWDEIVFNRIVTQNSVSNS